MSPKVTVDKKVIITQLDIIDKNEVLTAVSKLLIDSGYVKNSYTEGIIEREKVFPTGLPTGEYGVAIPHTDVEHVNEPMIAVATLKYPVEFNIMGGEKEDKVDVKIIFMLAMKDGNEQIVLLQKIMGIIQDSSLLERIYNTQDIQGLTKLINSELSA